ncbi:MAG: hypothetical protein DMF04_02740 [Verrucomicrobia bacterium]|nr:MAG: hypothetical protein DMF04_02740 [Verrucomicrobiota bacterium]
MRRHSESGTYSVRLKSTGSAFGKIWRLFFWVAKQRLPRNAQIQASTYAELGRVKEDLKVWLNPQEPLT